MSWHFQSASDVVSQLGKDLGPADLVKHLSERYEATEPRVRAFLSFDAERALRESQSVSPASRLGGIPIAVKDNICTLDGNTTAGSRLLEQFRAPYEATVIKRLRNAGAVVLGKTNLDEFGMGSSTENSAFAKTHNPWNLTRVPGGSSGGSAAAVAAGSSIWALGSDTGGSIRQPAAFCGVTGLKPTYGRVSRLGLVAFASSLEQIGPITQNAQDAALLMSIIAGHDPLDATSSNRPVDDYINAIEQPIQGLKIGLLQDQLEGLSPELVATLVRAKERLQDLGAQVTKVTSKFSMAAVSAYYIIAGCEASSNLARYDGVRYTCRAEETNLLDMYQKTRADHFGSEVKRRILLGTFALSSGYYDEYYLQASKIRRLIKDEFDRTFQTVDLLLGPTTPTTAFPLSETERPPLELYRGDVFTVSANLAGLPAINIPGGFDETGLPIGIQMLAPQFDEARLLQVAHQYQLATDWHSRRPQL